MKKTKIIKDICKNNKFNSVSNWEYIEKRKVLNIRKHLKIGNEHILWFYDYSMFNNGKLGLAICEGGVYWKNIFDNANYITWERFEHIKVSIGEREVIFNECGEVQVLSDDIINVSKFLREIQVALNNITNEEETERRLKIETERRLKIEKERKLIKDCEKVQAFLKYIDSSILDKIQTNEVKSKNEFAEMLIMVAESAAGFSGDYKVLSFFEDLIEEAKIKQDTANLRDSLKSHIDITDKIIKSNNFEFLDFLDITIKGSFMEYNQNVTGVFNNIKGSRNCIKEVTENMGEAVKDLRLKLDVINIECSKRSKT